MLIHENRVRTLFAALAVPSLLLVAALWAVPSKATGGNQTGTEQPGEGGSLAGGAGGFERTEKRTPCRSFDRWRQPFFGETHVHTALSFDARARFVQASPRDAYAFAQGAPITTVDAFGLPTRTHQIERPIDWGAVTDHGEFFGEIGVCDSNDLPGRFSFECQLLNGFYWQGTPDVLPIPPVQRGLAGAALALLATPSFAPSSRHSNLPMCGAAGVDCNASEMTVWHEMQEAAEEAYDRSADCEFTSFVGYEMTATPLFVNWHRNVIFRNDRVVDRPVTSIDMAREVNPDPLRVAPQILTATSAKDPNAGPDLNKFFDGLIKGCLDKGNGCDVISIPHNANLGPEIGPTPAMYADPLTPEDAAKRQKMEPLMEMYQHKGASECRWDPRFQKGVDTNDEDCDFELLETDSLIAAAGFGAAGAGESVPPERFDSRTQLRNILKNGLLYEQRHGVNPFKLGMIAATDSHNGEMGWTPEDASWGGALGMEDANPVGSHIQSSSGGLAVAWAEENSRDSIFDALKRRETYATSGTRPTVRFFGGWNFNRNECRRNFVRTGYQIGVPMGGDLPTPRAGQRRRGPDFIVSAEYDDFVGTPLQQIQIIKGWVEGEQTREAVYTVAGNPNNGATVDQQCNRVGRGAESLCSVWSDPDWNPREPAFYYVRVLENPVCRFSTVKCQQDFGVNPLALNCEEQLAELRELNPIRGSQAANCCKNDLSAGLSVQPIIQERAWTSPIWYTPRSGRH